MNSLLRIFIKLEINIFERFIKLNKKINQNDYYRRLKIMYNKYINILSYINLRNYY